MPRSPEKHQATLRKLERYDAYVCGLADAPAGLSHYEVAHPDGWPCELLFVVPTGSRQQSTASVLGTFRASRNSRCVSALAFALPEAAAYLRKFLPPPAAGMSSTGSRVAARTASSRFYDEVDHRAVKTFVLEMSAALDQANAALRRRHLPPVSKPPSSAGMLAFLKRAQAEMQRRRESPSNAPP